MILHFVEDHRMILHIYDARIHVLFSYIYAP